MSKKTLYLLGILLTILIGTYFYWKLCCNDCCDGDALKAGDRTERTLSNEVDTNTKVATSNAFALNDANGDFSFNANENFNFNASAYDALTPINAQVDVGIGKLQAYLDTNKNKTVAITGHYTSGESNNSAYPNLGLARANAVKNYFVSKGISSGQMNTFGKLTESLVPDGTIYKGPITYSISTSTDNTAKEEANNMKALRDNINANPLVLYFETAQASINLSATQRQKIADISKYLDKNPEGMISIVGHTDNTGSRTTNVRLGQERADFAKGYFVRNGIPEAKIITSSLGPDQPVATNATEEGRTKNRRTEVTIK